MNKTELVEKMADSADISKAAAARALDAMLDTITQTLNASEQVVLAGFGTFAVKDRPPRTGRNPKTGEPIEIAASRVASFKAGKGLKDALN